MTRRAQQALRGTLASLVAVLLAAVSHTLGGGGAPAWWLVGSAIVLGAPIATALAGLRSRTLGVIGSVITAQVILHAGFSVIGSPSLTGTGAAPHSHALHFAAPESMTAAAAPVAAAASASASGAMVLAHGCAALVTILLLLLAERAVHAIRSWILRRALLPVPAAVSPRPRTLSSTSRTLVRRPERCSPRTRRGPPRRSIARIRIAVART